MPRSGDTYSLPYNWVDDAANGINAQASRFQAQDDDVADALTESATIAKLQTGAYQSGTAGGTANALTATLSPAPTAYADGMRVMVKAAYANTGAATLNVNGLGAYAIRHVDGTALSADNIQANRWYEVTLDLSNTRWILGPAFVPLVALPAQAQNTVIGRTASGSGAPSALSAPMVGVVTAADAAAARTVLGLGTAATQDTTAILASPALTGTPTAPTAADGTNTTQLATTAFVRAAIAALVDSSPAALDTLNELAAALGDDPNFATTVTNALALKASKSGDTFTGAILVDMGTAGRLRLLGASNKGYLQAGYGDGSTTGGELQITGINGTQANLVNISATSFTLNGFSIGTLTANAPSDPAATASVGVGAGAARSDHQHRYQPEVWAVALSDRTTNLATGTNVGSMHAPYAATILEALVGVDVAQTAGSVLTFDVNVAGSTVLSTKVTIDNNEDTSATAATAPVLSSTSVAKGAKITWDIDQVGTAGAKGAVGYLVVRRAS